MRKVSLVLLVLFLISSIIAGCGGAQPEKPAETAKEPEKAPEKAFVMKFAHSEPPGPQGPYTYYSEKFMEEINKRTNGRIKVELYPGGQLGGEQRVIQDVQNNIAQATIVAVNNVTVYSPSMGAFDLPYMFTSVEDFDKVIKENRDLLNKKLEDEAGLIALSWTQQHFRVLNNSKKPVKNINDLKGLKIRVPQNPLQIAAFKSWNCEPAPIDWAETFAAVQQKVVDGQENPYVSIYANKFHEITKYTTEIHYKLWVGPMVVNKEWFDALPQDLQKAVIEAGLAAEKASNEFMGKLTEEAKDLLIKAGIEVYGAPDDEPIWVEKAMSVWPQFYDKIGDPFVLDSFLKTLGREKPKA
ncbi:MAG: TRAP transporter substrate-binding protein [Bacillota bacterium]